MTTETILTSGAANEQITNAAPEGGASAPSAAASVAPPSGANLNGPSKTWRDSLPEELREDPSLAVFSDVANLAKSYLHQKSAIGKKGVIVPGEKATDEEWQNFYKSIGRPELDKFELKTPKAEIDEYLFEGYKKIAHEAGLLPKQAQHIVEKFTEIQQAKLQENIKALEAEAKKQQEDLQKEWGEGFEKNLYAARVAVEEFGGDSFKQYLRETGLGNDTQLIRFMSKLGNMLAEDKIRGEGGVKFGMTPDEIQGEIDSIRGDYKHPYYDTSHPNHARAVAEMGELYKKLNQSKTKKF